MIVDVAVAKTNIAVNSIIKCNIALERDFHANDMRFVAERRGQGLDLEKIPLDDEATFKLLGEGQTFGVFQLESSGMRDLLRRLKPRSLEEIFALNAMYRPGPMGIIDEYIQRKQGKLPIRYPHPALEPVLRETYGTIIYQEQVMEIAVRLGNFTFGQADLLRRAMGKKNRELIEQQRDRFIQGAKGQGLSEELAEEIFDRLARFGEYGFNKSHSLAYAWVAYQTAYLKANHPLEYLAAMLSNEMGNTDKIAQYVGECRRMGVEVLGPSVNHSRERFSIEGRGIRFGLAAIRNVGLGAAEALVREREQNGAYADFGDFCSRINTRQIHARVIESLIKGGALDVLTASRSALLESLPRFLAAGQKKHQEREEGQGSLFETLLPGAWQTPAAAPTVPDPENTRLAHEQEALGFYLTGHPLAQVQPLLAAFSTITTSRLNEQPEGRPVVIGGLVVGLKHSLTKRKEPMLRFSLEDLEGLVEVIVWPDLLGRHNQYLTKETMLFVVGRVDRSSDESKIIASDIIPLAQAYERLGKCLHLTVMNTVGEELLRELKSLLAAHRGPLRVKLHLQTGHHGEVVEMLPEPYGVHLSPELLAALQGLLGESRVAIESQRPGAPELNGSSEYH